MGTLLPPKTGHSSHQFSAQVYCGQTARWIKMPLGRDVGLGTGDIVLDGDSAPPPPPQKGHSMPIFGPCLVWPNGWIHQDATWYGSRTRPRRYCVRCGPAPPQMGHGRKIWHGHQNFQPMSIVAKRLPISATAEFLFKAQDGGSHYIWKKMSLYTKNS